MRRATPAGVDCTDRGLTTTCRSLQTMAKRTVRRTRASTQSPILSRDLEGEEHGLLVHTRAGLIAIEDEQITRILTPSATSALVLALIHAMGELLACAPRLRPADREHVRCERSSTISSANGDRSPSDRRRVRPWAWSCSSWARSWRGCTSPVKLQYPDGRVVECGTSLTWQGSMGSLVEQQREAQCINDHRAQGAVRL